MNPDAQDTSPTARVVLRPEDPDVNAYAMINSLVVPRPIAWVSTLDGEGVGNLAPHSFFSVASSAPLVVCFTSVGRKDTLANVLATGEFVINVVSTPQIVECNTTSAMLPSSIDEAALVGVGMEPSETVAPPRVAGSPASIECTLHSTVEVGNSVLVLGDVRAMTIRTEVMKDGAVDVLALDPLARLGGTEWSSLGAIHNASRPDPEDVLREAGASATTS